ncbi:ornithine cyclodeaminase family protein [Dehalogenimonas alkenigignens]|uniref:Putative alanine dehydrogenase n=1 Tax=Dehalogenimonas alkenigignens TaxID=1217799 RepID=A0A0W0GKJ1_9CHLR|nr:alanine dehydrogenase [Dehalogenimonas alkenigignens]KTB49048.1 L-alanine dehydrogenase [Dehalogenimonas alkenigignens]PVV83156.1 ornithine cyclodeaminase family protein [Dehalogenimonas alkenigignens]
MSTLLLTRADTLGLMSMPDVLNAVEQAFSDYARNMASMPSKAYLTLPEGDFRAMPAQIPGAAGLKWVNVHPGNYRRNLPTVMAVIIYSDPETGYPLSIMDATEITAYRTGAAAAIASKYLARKDARTLGLVGAGKQAQTQLLAHAEYFQFEEIMVYDSSAEAAAHFKALFPGFPITAASLEKTAGADIVCTLTPVRSPIIMRDWIKPGAHINAVGADAPGKQELDPAILDEACVVVDDIEQSIHAGELNMPVKSGLFNRDRIYATLGELTSGQKSGRSNNTEITVFDSTGLAVQDVATAKIVFNRALERGIGFRFDFIEKISEPVSSPTKGPHSQ